MTDDIPFPLQEFLEGLYRRRARGIHLGLETVQALLASLGHPETDLTPIHVAGTNGKGSVCAMVESVLRAAGHPTGLFTSPHLMAFNERVRVNGEAISDQDLCDLLQEVEVHADAVAADLRQPTFFEFTAAAALQWFRARSTPLAVLETGLGGRLDATNVVDPLVVVITAIGRDHTAFLGSELPDIAAEKGGIIKPRRPVVCGHMEPVAREVIHRMARERGAPLIDVRDAVSIQRLGTGLDGQKVRVDTASRRLRPFVLPLLGAHQIENLAAAVAALDYLEERGAVPVPDDALRQGLSRVQWPARCQVLSRDPIVVLDAAHNPAGAAVLVEALAEICGDRPLGLVAGFSLDKDAVGFFRSFTGRLARCWAVCFNNPRSRSAEESAAMASAAGIHAETAALADALQQARDWAADEGGAVCVAGSVYLAGEVLEMGGAGSDA